MNIKLSVLLVCLTLFQPAAADSDHYEARRLMESGTILPLETVLETVQLEQRHDHYIYEIEMLDQTGRVWEMRIDAVTGQVLNSEQED